MNRAENKGTPFQCSVHTHTTLCDGAGTPAEMAESACRMGVKYYGFSGHSHSPNPADFGFNLPDDTSAYKREVLELRERYAGRMEILLGIEWDSWSAGKPEGYDYWIGSVHSVRGAAGSFYGVDYDPPTLLRGRDELCGGDIFALAEKYYRAVAEMALRKPTILGHIDLMTKYNEGNALFDEGSPRYRRAALGALHAADPDATLLEINTGAMARGFRKTPYPAPFLLKEWKSMGGRVILTADAHHPDTIVYAYAEAAEAAKNAGFRTAAILTGAGVAECAL